ncbi:MAG: TonB-dependent receptor [Candidatus Pedobacter colombiensis]|uniref:TonB-dependent receptor n=1 Tax=Candidatus Pedobacter colombiensis TaxID=3121371 RepID=A0AAJ5W338_9SPHI|nr:TonB-dependent receptor [Pedobacter sp.]WEK17603.1 MAG: TonB-dependent receptor [Pedobacter sp.]
MTRPISYFCLFFFLSISTTFAQSKGIITGKVIELPSKKPFEFVNIVLKRKTDSTVVIHEVTNAKGQFNLTAVPDGKYFIQTSFVGYDDSRTAFFDINAQHPKANFNINMDGAKKTLNEVQVISQKNIFTNSIDRKIYHVDMDIMAKSGSASEVLQNVPLVQVDLDGNVSLRNSAVTILINGKISPLMGKNAAAALQQLPANSIEKIEVITNPSAKYKPDGTGGIINIVLKKSTKRGLNGNITANGGNNDRYNVGTTINYKPGKLNVFGSYSVKQDDRIRTTTNDRVQTDPNTGATNYYNDRMIGKTRPFSNIATLGFDYNINDKNSFGLSGNYYLRNMHKHDLTVKQVRNAISGNQDYDRKRENFEQEKASEATLYYEHAFKGEDHKLRLEFNVTHSPEIEDNHYTNTYRFPVIPDQLDNTIIKQTSDNKHVSLSYEYPISEQSKIEAGYDGQFNKQDLDFYGAEFDNRSQQFVTDINKTNRFIYYENVHAIYGTISKEAKKIGVMIGLRGEYSDINSKLITNNTAIPNHYFKIYPTLHFTYKIKDNKEMQLNYSRRVRRPEGDNLNPFAEYADPTNIKVGNPYLLPEIIHSVEIGYQWRKNGISIMPGIYYRYTYNRFTSVTTPLNDSVLVTRQQNLANDQAIGADVVFSGNFNDKLNLNFTPNIFYNQIDASNLGYSNKKSTIAWAANLNATYAITKGTSLQINSNYKSTRLTPQGKYLPSFVMNCGAKQDLLGKKGAIYFTVSDLFKSQRQEINLQGPLLTQHVLTKSNSRIIYLGLSYNFGVVKKKKDMQFDNSL